MLFFMTRPAARNQSIRQGESCSVKRTEQWKPFHQHRMLYCNTLNVLPTRLGSGQQVICHYSNHLVQKDVVGLWIKQYGPCYLWLQKHALNLSNVSVKVSKVVEQGVHARKQTGNVLNYVAAPVTSDNIKTLLIIFRVFKFRN